jgi:hypothetical protein
VLEWVWQLEDKALHHTHAEPPVPTAKGAAYRTAAPVPSTAPTNGKASVAVVNGGGAPHGGGLSKDVVQAATADSSSVATPLSAAAGGTRAGPASAGSQAESHATGALVAGTDGTGEVPPTTDLSSRVHVVNKLQSFNIDTQDVEVESHVADAAKSSAEALAAATAETGDSGSPLVRAAAKPGLPPTAPPPGASIAKPSQADAAGASVAAGAGSTSATPPPAAVKGKRTSSSRAGAASSGTYLAPTASSACKTRASGSGDATASVATTPSSPGPESKAAGGATAAAPSPAGKLGHSGSKRGGGGWDSSTKLPPPADEGIVSAIPRSSASGGVTATASKRVSETGKASKRASGTGETAVTPSAVNK